MKSSLAPFLVVNPKSYLYGKESLALAKAADDAAKKTGLKIYFTCPFSDIRYIRENTDAIIVTAQAMESLKPGRGMGHLLPEALYDAGAARDVPQPCREPDDDGGTRKDHRPRTRARHRDDCMRRFACRGHGHRCIPA